MGMVFRFQAYDAHGQVVAGRIEANSMPDALSQLEARGLLPFEAAPLLAGAATPEPAVRTRSHRSTLAPEELADFMSQFGTLIGAELPLDRALKLLGAQTRSKTAKALASGLHASILAGASLSSAFAEHAPSAPGFVGGLLRAGEARGHLGDAVGEAARILRARAEMNARIRSALA